MSDIHENSPGRNPSVVRSFGIRGLYGYRNVSLETDYAASILIAKNGSGKTTLLGAMDAFLRGQFTRLRGLAFSEIFCRLRGVEAEQVLTHKDLTDFFEVPAEGEIVKLARQTENDIAALFTFFIEEWPAIRADFRAWHDTPIPSAIIRSLEWDYQEAQAYGDKVREQLFTRTEKMAGIYKALSAALADIEIVYLPTYRRVELTLPEEKERRASNKPKKKFKTDPGSLHQADIQFGLTDISDRLSEMNQRILLQSNSGYREISANIIKELMGGDFPQDTSRPIPLRDELSLFLSRLAASERYGPRMGPYYPVAPMDLDRIYKDELQGPAASFLNYFLNKLDTVIKATHSIELQVEEFIKRCNQYLMYAEVTAEPKVLDVDAKSLRLNKENLRVHVESLVSEKKMSLDALSSGEKQMVSLFGKLYLYDKEKLVLIDEPELSLSIDWQKQILVDVMNAPMCRQIIAITHSPFVFDNSLLPFAKSLKVEISNAQPSTDNSFEVDLG